MISRVAKSQPAGVVGIAVVEFIKRRRLPGVKPLDKCEIAGMNTLGAKGPTAGQMSGMWGWGAHNLVIGLMIGLVTGRQSTVADPASSGTVVLMQRPATALHDWHFSDVGPPRQFPDPLITDPAKPL